MIQQNKIIRTEQNYNKNRIEQYKNNNSYLKQINRLKQNEINWH